MNALETTPSFFYLVFDEQIPKHFYEFRQHLSREGVMLVPIRIEQVQSILSTTSQEQIILIQSVANVQQLNQYQKKIRPYLKYILKSKRITLLHFSSFSKIDDSKQFHSLRNYFFIRFPVSLFELAPKIVRYYELKSTELTLWPGRRAPRLSSEVG